jgi:hypothetical protein
MAAAIGSILALWPSPDPEDTANITVRIVPGMTLTEYHERFNGVVVSQGEGAIGAPLRASAWVQLSARSVIQPTLDEPTLDEPTLDEPTLDEPTLDEPTLDEPTLDEPTPDESTPDESTPVPVALLEAWSSDAPIAIPPGSSLEETKTHVETAKEWMLEQPDLNLGIALEKDNPGSHQLLIGASEDSQGKLLELDEATERLAELFSEIRTSSEQSDGLVELLGVLVIADVELSGLRGKQVLLSWSIFQQEGGGRLFGKWLATNPTYVLVAGTDKDTTTVRMWVPLPKAPGPYIVHLDLTTEGSYLGSIESDPFN